MSTIIDNRDQDQKNFEAANQYFFSDADLEELLNYIVIKEPYKKKDYKLSKPYLLIIIKMSKAVFELFAERKITPPIGINDDTYLKYLATERNSTNRKLLIEACHGLFLVLSGYIAGPLTRPDNDSVDFEGYGPVYNNFEDAINSIERATLNSMICPLLGTNYEYMSSVQNSTSTTTMNRTDNTKMFFPANIMPLLNRKFDKVKKIRLDLKFFMESNSVESITSNVSKKLNNLKFAADAYIFVVKDSILVNLKRVEDSLHEDVKKKVIFFEDGFYFWRRDVMKSYIT